MQLLLSCLIHSPSAAFAIKLTHVEDLMLSNCYYNTESKTTLKNSTTGIATAFKKLRRGEVVARLGRCSIGEVVAYLVCRDMTAHDQHRQL